MTSEEAIGQLQQLFENHNGKIKVSQQVGNPFTAELTNQDGVDGISVSNLGNYPFLSWDVFKVTIDLLNEQGGTAIRGNSMNYRLGENELPTNSVEGCIAQRIYNKQNGDIVFRRISPVANLLVYAEICRHGRGVLILNERQGWFTCNTLARRNEFIWKYDENGGVSIESGNTRANFSIDDINAVIDHIYNNREGVQLGSCVDGDIPQNSIGWLLQQRKITGYTRSWCTYLAAILVSEGMINYEYLGRGPGRGIWLYPDIDDISVTPTDNLDTIIDQETEEVGEQIDGINPLDINGLDLRDVFKEISSQLTNLANKIETTQVYQVVKYPFQFSELNLENADSLRKKIKAWENQNPDSLYIYIYEANDEANLNSINKEYASTRDKNIENRAFARINKGNPESKVLYVGSSRSVGQRTKDHLGFSSKKVFALQIYHWSRELDGGIELEILRFPSTTDHDVIQTIEDGLWNKLRPMFGRQGQR